MLSSLRPPCWCQFPSQLYTQQWKSQLELGETERKTETKKHDTARRRPAHASVAADRKDKSVLTSVTLPDLVICLRIPTLIAFQLLMSPAKAMRKED